MKKWRLRSRNQRLTAVGILCADHATPSTRKVGTNFADMRRSLGRYSSLAEYGKGVYLFFLSPLKAGGEIEETIGVISNLDAIVSKTVVRQQYRVKHE
jgi:hypothetical protein